MSTIQMASGIVFCIILTAVFAFGIWLDCHRPPFKCPEQPHPPPAPPLQDTPGFQRSKDTATRFTHVLPVVEWERNGRCVCIHRREAADSGLDPCHINRYLRIPKRAYIRHLATLNPQLLRFAGGAK